jgi:hypothetical protein
MYRTRPSFFISLRTARCSGTSAAADTMTKSILGTLNVANFSSIAALTAAAAGFSGGPAYPGRTGIETISGVVQKNLS